MIPSSSTSDALNFFPARPGLVLNDGRYQILRKLGAGVYSSTWLVSDAKAEIGFKYLAAKILSAEGTRMHDEGTMRELEFLKAIQACEDINSLPILRNHFQMKGPKGASHLCFVMDLLSTDLSSFRRSAPNKALPPYMVKNIIAQVLEALIQLHSLNIIHTDLKLDNILFNAVGDDEQVEKMLSNEPPAIEGEFELDDHDYPLLRSQPIPHKFSWDSSPHIAELMTVTVIDLGQAQWAGKQPTVNQFSAFALRPPEIILRSDFGPKVDIWALGCITFELLVGRWLFNPEGGEDWRLEDDHLAKMMELTGERFSGAMLARSQLRDEYFDAEGNLLRIDDIMPVSLESAMANYNILPKDEIGPAAAFIRACLRLDSSERASAKELELHSWLKGAFTC